MASQSTKKELDADEPCEDKALEKALSDAGVDGEILDQLPDEARSVILHSISKIYKGPLPPAEELEKYENVMPGASDRIFQMAETQAKHRQTMETENINLTKEINQKIVENETVNNSRGLIFGFIIALVFAIGGFVLILMNKPTSGFISLILPIVSIVGAFIYRRKNNQRIEEQVPDENESNKKDE
ncbi:DUF2335 domain-containing protein [Listeria kieliensis]